VLRSGSGFHTNTLPIPSTLVRTKTIPFFEVLYRFSVANPTLETRAI
jgi:hypothetical protein